MLILGVTGGLSTGKTTATKYFKDLGVKVINADNIAHQCYKDPKCFKRIVGCFGKEILRGKIIDRKRLSDIVFGHPRNLNKLEKIIHPMVVKELKQEIRNFKKNKKEGMLAVDVPLLFEVGLDKYVDKTVVVKSALKIQLERAIRQLGITKQQAQLRIDAQMPLKEKIRLADFIINNSGTLNQTKKQVKEIWLKLQ